MSMASGSSLYFHVLWLSDQHLANQTPEELLEKSGGEQKEFQQFVGYVVEKIEEVPAQYFCQVLKPKNELPHPSPTSSILLPRTTQQHSVIRKRSKSHEKTGNFPGMSSGSSSDQEERQRGLIRRLCPRKDWFYKQATTRNSDVLPQRELKVEYSGSALETAF